MTVAQILAVSIFVVMFVLMVLDKIEKQYITLVAGALTLILVFDAYKVKGGIGQMLDYHNIHVVYTKEAETADQYIEKLAHNMGREHDVTVATSDGLEQLIIRGQGCKLWSAREFYAEVKRVEEALSLIHI